MSDVEYFGRVAQKPAKVDEGRHPFFNGKWNRTKAVKPEPVVLEETRVRDEVAPYEN